MGGRVRSIGKAVHRLYGAALREATIREGSHKGGLDWYVAKAPQRLANRDALYANTVTKAGDVTSNNLAETQATAVVRGLLFRSVAGR